MTVTLKPATFAFLNGLFALLIVLLLPVAGAHAEPSRSLVIGSEVDYPPFALGGPGSEPSGFTVELWRAVAQEAGLQYTFEVAPFHDILHAFQIGKIDVLINLAQSAERRQFADFSVSHVKTYGAIFARTGVRGIETEADLAGKALIVMESDLAHNYAIEHGWEDNLLLVDDTASGLRELAAGAGDVMLVNKIVGLQTLRDYDIAGIEALPIQLPFFQQFSFAVHKGEAELLAKINEGLAITKVDGRYGEIYEKWFGLYTLHRVTFAEIVAVAWPYVVPAVSLLLFAVIGVAYTRQARLMRKLAERTARLQRSQMEVELLNADLERRVRDRTARLQQVNESLNQEIEGHRRTERKLVQAKLGAEAASEAKSRFLATMSHELRTPMNGVLGFAQLIEHAAKGDELRQYAMLLQRSGENLLHIINDILDISKIEAGELDVEQVPFDLGAVVEHVVVAQSIQAVERRVGLSHDIAPSVARWVLGDETRIRQVLSNLLANAVKFTEDGTVEVAVTMEAAGEAAGEAPGEAVGEAPGEAAGEAATALDAPQMRPHLQDAMVRFTVTDSGIGIALEAQKNLFRPFVQADTSTTRRYGGTGLGLAIARQLVELMGGSIGVDSELGQGAQFWFVVPLPAATVGAGRAATAAATATATGEMPPLHGRVLLAEDNQTNQEVARQMLRSFGLDVDVVESGTQAVAAWERGRFDMVLMDCLMPEMDGFAATRKIREREGAECEAQAGASLDGGHTPIIAMTASALAGDREHCISVGMDDYLPKPFQRHMLYRVVERWLN